MSAVTTPALRAAASDSTPSQRPAKPFNWADDAASSSDDEADVGPLEDALDKTPTRSQQLIRKQQQSDANDDLAVRELLSAAATVAAAEAQQQHHHHHHIGGFTPSRLSQEVTINAAIPYKLKSVWNPSAGTSPAPAINSSSTADMLLSSLGNSPSSSAAAGGYNPNGPRTRTNPFAGGSPVPAAANSSSNSNAAASSSTAASSAGLGNNSNTVTAAGASTQQQQQQYQQRPVRVNRAVDELTSVLRANGGSLPYDELMVKAQWRSRYQPSFGSLFTFLKRNRDIFHYQQSVVKLVQEGSIVAELLRMTQWNATSSSVEVNNKICGYNNSALTGSGGGGIHNSNGGGANAVGSVGNNDHIVGSPVGSGKGNTP